MEIGEDVIGCECDELASTQKHLPKKVESVVGVGEADGEPDLVFTVAPSKYPWSWNMVSVPRGRLRWS
jgi:hypothetical protein